MYIAIVLLMIIIGLLLIGICKIDEALDYLDYLEMQSWKEDDDGK